MDAVADHLSERVHGSPQAPATPDTAVSPQGAFGLGRRAAPILRRQVVAELVGGLHHGRHARPHHVEARLDHGPIEASLAAGRLTLAREPFNLAAVGGRRTRVWPVPKLIADEIWNVTPSPLGLLTSGSPRDSEASVTPLTAAAGRTRSGLARR